MSAPKTWTPERIYQALREVAEREGATPSAREWRRVGASPALSTIARECGSWAKAVAGAGLTPKAIGRPGGTADEETREIIARLQAGESRYTVARAYGLAFNSLLQRVRRYLYAHDLPPVAGIGSGPNDDRAREEQQLNDPARELPARARTPGAKRSSRSQES